MKLLLSGNEALALGAYHAGVRVAAGYPGTPSTEILEALAKYKDIYTEWSTNEKVAMEVAMGASYTGVRTVVSMKHVGLNVASDPFMAAAGTGVVGGMVVISADDPGMHSSQNEQDNRHYARLAKVPILEPSDSQSAYELMLLAFEISEQFDTPVMVRTTTRISHSSSVVEATGERPSGLPAPRFSQDAAKFVMLPVHARRRHPLAIARIQALAAYSETFTHNQIDWNGLELGIITSGIVYQYAREVFKDASFLNLGLSYPLPVKLIRQLATSVKRLMVIEELDPFMEDQIKAMGISVDGKNAVPSTGELSPDIVRDAAIKLGVIEGTPRQPSAKTGLPALPPRPPLLCPGCPHTGIFYILSSMGIRKRTEGENPGLVICGDIGCYTLAAYAPLSAIDTCACMGAGIGQAQGMHHAGLTQKIVAVIGDSTFLHSGLTSLINAVYNQANTLTIILDNGTTAMTGHQPHPGSGKTSQGSPAPAVDLAALVRAAGVQNLQVVDDFNLAKLRAAVKTALEDTTPSVIITRGECAILSKKRSPSLSIDHEKCNLCGNCLKLGCPAIQKQPEAVVINTSQCFGAACSLCAQVCPRQAIKP
jgi:indolepyruvate ferredoxin oxidoreductase alpha subunit